MNPSSDPKAFVAIACGGTGGHLFPGLAVAEELRRNGVVVGLLISPKDVDQQAVQSLTDVEIFTLPAVGLQNRNYFSFARSFWKSFGLARKLFLERRPQAVLAMGGFTSAPPILAAKLAGLKTYLHESNTIPGRANRLLARFVDEAFVGFSEAATRLSARKTTATGTPVRSRLTPHENGAGEKSVARESAGCRVALGLEPNRPTLLVVGGSQGASGLNNLILSALPLLKDRNWQWLHLSGVHDFERVKSVYAARGIPAVVKPFLAEMDLALGAATACVSRAGASSLAELAACRLPVLLVPFPAAADNHQFFNASAFAKTGAAKLIEQKHANPEVVAAWLTELVENADARSKMQAALASWYAPAAASRIAESILRSIAGQPEAIVSSMPPPVGRARVSDPAKAIH